MNFSMKIYINFRKFESFHSKKNFNLAKIVRMVESLFFERETGKGKRPRVTEDGTLIISIALA